MDDARDLRTARGVNVLTEGWLGKQERAHNSAAGLYRMGVRLYDPLVGRFTASDPVEGGSANSYDYANASPCNNLDLTGTESYSNITEPLTLFKTEHLVGPCKAGYRKVAKYSFRQVKVTRTTYRGKTDFSYDGEFYTLETFVQWGYAGAISITTCEGGHLVRRQYYDHLVKRNKNYPNIVGLPSTTPSYGSWRTA